MSVWALNVFVEVLRGKVFLELPVGRVECFENVDYEAVVGGACVDCADGGRMVCGWIRGVGGNFFDF